MYKRHNIWDEDKWDIHSDSSGSGYAGHGPGTAHEDYHKHELYSKEDEDRNKDAYSSMRQDEDKKKEEKEDEEKEKNIVDAVEQEEKYQKNKEEGEIQHHHLGISQEMQHSLDTSNHDKDKTSKNKQKKSIEEAIEEAIKEEKEVVHVD